MRKILLQFADGDFLVSPETADRVKQVVPANRFVTTTTVEVPDPDLPTRLGVKGQSVFERHRTDNLTPKQRQLAERMSKHLTPPSKK